MQASNTDYIPEFNVQYKLDYKNPQVVFVLGGPGSGKGTQCERLVRDYHFQHISTGDIMRAEIQQESPEGLRVKEIVAKGQMVPDDLIVNLLYKNIIARQAQKYLIDGFPRGLNQAKLLESRFKEVDLILNFDVKEEILVKRLLKRGIDSGRSDDNEQTIKDRVTVFKKETVPVIQFYTNHGKVRTINGEGEIEEIYKNVQKFVAPEIIFLYGPPCTGLTSAAQQLSEIINYQLINLKDFYAQVKPVNEIDQVNKLIHFLNNSPFRRVVIDQFFDNIKQAMVFFDHFSKPIRLFAFQAPKDQIESNIQKYTLDPQKRAARRAQLDVYLQNRSDLNKYLSKQSYYVTVPALADPIQTIVRERLLGSLKPLVISTREHNNQDLAAQYNDALVKERGYTFLDIQELIEEEGARGTSLGQRMSAFSGSGQKVPTTMKMELIQKIFFSNPLEQRKFILQGFPDTPKEFKDFKTNLFAVNYLIDYQKPNYVSAHVIKVDARHIFYKRGQLIEIDKPNLNIFDSYIEKQPRYGFVFGPKSAGKTTLAQHISTTFGYQLIDFNDEKLIEEIKKMFTQPEEEPPAEVTYPMVQAFFAQNMNPSVTKDIFLFDGFTYGLNNLRIFIEKIGAPEFMINLLISKQALFKRNKIKEGSEAPEGEIPPEELENSEKLIKEHDETAKYLEQVAINNYGVQLYNLEVQISLDSTQRLINSLLFKRIIVVNNYTPLDHVDERNSQKVLFYNFAIKNKIIFVDVNYLIRAHFKGKNAAFNADANNQYNMRWSSVNEQFASHYTPQLVVKIIKSYLDSIPYQNRQVILFNYPSADTPTDRKAYELYFPRASDELYDIEKNLGPVRMVVVLTDKKLATKIEDPQMDIQKPEPPQKKKADGDEGDEEAPDAAVEEVKEDPPADQEQGKPKFNIYDFEWSQCDGVPKSLAQWFTKTKFTLRKVLNYENHGSKGIDEKLKEYLALLNSETEQNKEILEYRKINLLVQLCYSADVEDEEHMENEVL